MKYIEAVAPASVANIGPLFDLGGLAVTYAYDRVRVRLVGEGVSRIRVVSENPRLNGRNNIAYHAAENVLRMTGERAEVHIEVVKGVPVGRGLGSSGATAAATVRALNYLLGNPLRLSDLIRCAGLAEGAFSGSPHFDNVATSLSGGLTVITDLSEFRVIKFSPPNEFKVALILPKWDFNPEGKTKAMREVLPGEVTLKDAIEWVSAALNLVSMAGNGMWEEVWKSTNYGGVVELRRGDLIKGYWEIKSAALESGALGVNISGAGPTIFAVVPERKLSELLEGIGPALRKYSYRVEVVDIEKLGARITSV